MCGWGWTEGKPQRSATGASASPPAPATPSGLAHAAGILTNSATWRTIEHDLAVFHRSSDLRVGRLHCDDLDRRYRAVLSADRPVSADHAAGRFDLDHLSRRQRP